MPDDISSDERPTVAVCVRCGKTAYHGGSDRSPGGHTPDADVAHRWPWCAFGDDWSWCATAEIYQTYG